MKKSHYLSIKLMFIAQDQEDILFFFFLEGEEGEGKGESEGEGSWRKKRRGGGLFCLAPNLS